MVLDAYDHENVMCAVTYISDALSPDAANAVLNGNARKLG